MKYNTYTFLILLMVYEWQRNSHCQFQSSLHLSVDVVEVKVQSQLHAAGLKSVQSALSDLKRPHERLQSQCNYRLFIT